VFPNLVSVTGLSLENGSNRVFPCFYQNYCDTIVTVGVLNDESKPCCRYNVEFLRDPIEGTSFATPIVSGRYLLNLQTSQPGPILNAKQFIDVFKAQPPLTAPFYTTNGRYIIYPH
jgi:hypothetical protein